MKEILMMILPGCPHCKNAERMIKELMEKHPEYRSLQIRREDETVNKALADSLDYYYVPCFFIDGKKIFEGVPSLKAVEGVLKEALKE